MTRAICVVLTEDQAIDVAEAISIRKSKLQDLIRRGVEIDPAKIDRLSVAGRCYDKALAEEGNTSSVSQV